MITLYHAAKCPFCARTRIVFAEKALSYRSVEVNLDQLSGELLQRSPKGQVPVIEDNGFVVYESQIINEYLEDQYRRPELMPILPQGRAKVRMIYDLCDSGLSKWAYSLKNSASGEASTSFDRAREQILPYLQKLSAELAQTGGYLLGDFTMADVALAPWVVGLEKVPGIQEQLSTSFVEWIQRLRARPSIAQDPYFELHKEVELRKAG